jgi:UDP-N-acetylmuramoyl-tripeptide--D-alanyl-D-alanine ligase
VTALTAASLAAICVSAVLAGLRFLRVAQREHYLAGSADRFALRWWRSSPLNMAAITAAVVAAALSWIWPVAAIGEAAVLAAAPFGLGVRGRTSRLGWTRRLTTLAAVVAAIGVAGTAAGAVAGGLAGAVGAASVVALVAPGLVDAGLAATRPIEDLLARRFVRRAAARLAEVRPLVVAITGSYGKTTTKGYIAHLSGASRRVVASPASFNNRAGLARTVNEHLVAGTEVLVAEMGTYGPGEIAEMCSWLNPRVSVITAIGPAHLERFRSLDRTLTAKAEIAATAEVVVLNVDDERLAALAETLRRAGKRVIAASGSDRAADVAVVLVAEGLELLVAGEPVGAASLASGDRPTSLSNLACAAAVALELEVASEDVLMRLPSVPVPPNRLQRYVADGGYVVLDDTFNSNPAGARLALQRLAQEAPTGRRVVVTPGMVELGRTQFAENAAFGEAAALVASDVVVVARTNRRALVEGARRAGSPSSVHVVDRLDEAVAWVRATLLSGDAVLYENDLPDHFP